MKFVMLSKKIIIARYKIPKYFFRSKVVQYVLKCGLTLEHIVLRLYHVDICLEEGVIFFLFIKKKVKLSNKSYWESQGFFLVQEVL